MGEIENFHFLRPAWLLMLPVSALILWKLRALLFRQSDWRGECDPALLQVLLVGSNASRQWEPLAGIGLIWLAAGLALAGPTWDQQPRPTYRSGHDRVIVFDLSRSMNAADLKPSRISQARFKLLDLVAGVKDRQQALIVFAGDAFLVSPLTDDYQTLTNLIPTLDTQTLPVQGSRSDKGLTMALELLENANSKGAEVILITDGINQQSTKIAKQLVRQSHHLNVLTVGTPEGAPIPLPNGGLLKSRNGNIIIPGVDIAAMKRLAKAGSGKFLSMRSDNRDVEFLNQKPVDGLEQYTAFRNATGLEGISWIDRGVWLVFPLILLGSLAFRKGWLLIALVFIVPQPQSAHAFGWQDLWLRPDQQASQAIDAEKPMSVPANASAWWRGTGAYRAGDHANAAEHFSEVNSVIGNYNLGNALAQTGKLETALDAYDEVLAEDPNHENAKFNREIVSKLLQQQSQQTGQSSEDDTEDAQEQSAPNSERDQSESDRGGNDQEQQQDQQDPSDQSANGDNAQGENKTEAESEQEKRQQLTDQNESGDDQQNNSNRTPQPADSTAAEQQQALNQWLKQVPDDPGGLLRRKFRHQFSQRTDQSKETQQW